MAGAVRQGGTADGRGKRRPVCWDHYPEALQLFVRGATFPTASRVSAVVGTWLTGVNHGGAIVSGSIPWVKVILNYLTPFVVTSVGFLAARRRTTLEQLWGELHADVIGAASDANLSGGGVDESIDNVKHGHRRSWEAGDYGTFAERVVEMADRLVEIVGVGPGMEVLDVATGTGNVAIRAAARGASVIGLDLTPKLLEEAERRATDAHVQVEWVEGDAEDLPFEDGRFDRVLSTFGVMLAPRHEVAAAELVRVCRRGGVIGLCNPTPGGWAGRFIALLAANLPPQPSVTPPPPLWGTESHVERLLGGAGIKLEFERQTMVLPFSSVEEGVVFFETNFGPLELAKRRLTPEGRWEPLRASVAELMASFNEVSEGLRLPIEYLLAVGHKPLR
jgi:SAM-dependent methyltransferase